jgi:CrcB protein
MTFLLVFLGGGLGAVSRYLVGSTLAVNLIGCFVVGALAGIFERVAPASPLRLLLVTGFLGGFTTFSAFGLESVQMLTGETPLAGVGNIFANVIGGLALAFIGLWITKKFI